MSPNTYYNPVKIIFGCNSFDSIGNLCKFHAENKKILIVSDKNLLQILKISDLLSDFLQQKNLVFDVFEKNEPNTTLDLIDHGTEIAREKDYGLIIGIGGGSAMDCAKCISILGKNPGKIRDYINNDKTFKNYGIPLIEIPTTSGTGSEVTKWATVWDMGDNKKKYSLSDDKMFAKIALVDPNLTLSLPPKMTAITGLDALSQAIEAYWSKNHNIFSDSYAIDAIKIINSNLLKAYKNPKDLKYRKEMVLGSLKSGLAFSNTKTTAVHSVSYPMTAHFNVPHGLACAFTLGQFLIYNSKKSDDNLKEAPERINEISNLLDAKNSIEASTKLSKLMKEMGLPTKLSEFGIDNDGIELIIKEGFNPDRVKHNPRYVTEENLRKILRNIQ